MKKLSKKEEVCMFPNCTKSTYGGGRGLCPVHYAGWRYHVVKGNKTWEELEKEGHCKRKMTKEEKAINQMHPHRTYKRRVKVSLDF